MFSRTERACLGLLVLIFTCFTWRSLTMFYSGDDMMNMHTAWIMNPWRLARAQFLIWEPVYRPVGGGVYRLFYALFGFDPQPLYIFCWLILIANIFVGYIFFRNVTSTMPEALIALSLVLVHGSFADLYYSAGTIYDHLCYLFTAGGLIAYFRFRKQPARLYFALTCLLAILAMGSKESGAAIVPLIVCGELFFFLPRSRRLWLRQTGPLLAALSVLALAFFFGRIRRTPGLLTNAFYAPHASASIWLSHVAEYLRLLTYGHLNFTSLTAAVLLAVTAVAAVAARNRTMIFGWLFFFISITPVAVIEIRQGYVLYLPVIGIGLFVASGMSYLIALLYRRFSLHKAGMLVFLLTTAAATWVHASNWPPAPDPRLSPEFRLTEYLSRTYPALPPYSKLLFASDEFPWAAYDLIFNVRLLYEDKTLLVYRLHAPPDQMPKAGHEPVYDHIFAFESGRYVELDRHNPSESVRLNILRGYAVGSEMDIGRPDHAAYIVSGVKDEENPEPSRWTDSHAKLKFRVVAQPTQFSIRYFVADVVANPPTRVLSILVNGKLIAERPLTTVGMRDETYPIPAGIIDENDYTIVDLSVINPYKDRDGTEYGVVLLRAGFTYRRPVSNSGS